MLSALESGEDFHSLTAATMFDKVKLAVQKGKARVNEEGDESVPLVKDVFKDYRKQAKILNFALAYGKTEFVSWQGSGGYE